MSPALLMVFASFGFASMGVCVKLASADYGVGEIIFYRGLVGAVLILAKPGNRARLIYFMGIDRVRYRRPVVAGDQVLFEATVVRLRSKMGTLRGVGRVDGKVACEGQMTFALGDAAGA